MSLLVTKTMYGRVRGIQRDGYTLFAGIPYAKPPVGELRFRAPQRPDPWDGIRPADHFGHRAPQHSQTGGFYGREFFNDDRNYTDACSEDCLSLNIWTPAEEPSEKRPVAVWIHGGAFTSGYSFEKEFDGASFARNGIVLVSVGYRLGVLGYLCHPDFTDCNFALLDLIAALRFVKENIAFFGGDPEHVTLFGQSSGAVSVQSILSSPLGEGLVQGAIMQSGAGYKKSLCVDCTRQEAERLALAVQKAAGADSAEDLRSIPWPQLLQAADETVERLHASPEESGRFPFGPVIDGRVLTCGYNQAIEENRLPDIPMLIGANEGDAICWVKDPQYLEQGCVAFAKRENALHQKPCYVYSFARHLPGEDNPGAFHSAELIYVFGTLDTCWWPMTEQDDALSAKMCGDWSAFMKNGVLEPSWRICTAEDPFVNTYDVTD